MTSRGEDDRIDVRAGVDTDLDGHADTLLVPGTAELVLAVDTDRDGFADLVIEVGPDAVAHSIPLGGPAGWVPTDPLADACFDESGGLYPPNPW